MSKGICSPIVLGLGATGGGGSGSPGPPGPAGAGYEATSTTSLAIASSGSKSFTTQAGLAYSVGARIRATSVALGDYMEGVVTSYSTTTLVATMDHASGSGTHTDWNINLAGDVGATGPAAGVPTGTGFVHITSGSQDPAAQLVANADIAAGAAIAFAKLATMADQTVLGNVTGGAAVPVALTQSDLRSLLAYAAIAVSGSASDLSAGTVPLARLAGITATQLSASAAIALTQLASQADATILGNNAGSPGAPIALTAAQVKTLLALATVASSGSASDLSTGTLPGGRMPALTGDVTSSAGSVATTVAAVNLGAATLTGTLPLANTAALTGDVTKTAGNNATVLAAANLGTATLTGTLPAANSPALTGDVTKTAGANNTVVAAVNLGTATLTSTLPAANLPAFTGNVTKPSGSTVLTIPAATVTEAMQVLANNTTNNATTSAHGYLPILSGIITDVLRGDGTYGWFQDPRRMAWAYEDFANGGAGCVGTRTSGTGAGVTFTNGAAGADGLVSLACGTSGTGVAAAGAITASNSTCLINLGDGVTTTEYRIRTPAALSDGTNTYTLRIGFIDVNNGEPTDGVYFRYIHSNNSGKWECVCRSNSTETAADSGVTMVVSTFYRMLIAVNAAGTSVAFTLDGVLVATVTTNIPTGATRATGWCASIVSSAGTLSRTMDIDYMWWSKTYTTPR